ncbi:hypothetical protein B484DRAFT_47542, partial [Ochromonadaceae sp. CCMP2298]
ASSHFLITAGAWREVLPFVSSPWKNPRSDHSALATVQGARPSGESVHRLAAGDMKKAAAKSAKGAAAAAAAAVKVEPSVKVEPAVKVEGVGALLAAFLAHPEEDGAFETALLDTVEKVKSRQTPGAEVVAMLREAKLTPEMGAANAAVVNTLWMCGSQVRRRQGQS